MKISEIKNIVLFQQMTDNEIKEALNSLYYEKKKFQKDETILHAGSPTEKMGIVLSGSVTIESIDILGNRTILSYVSVHDIFAETYAFLSQEPLGVNVSANEDCQILFLNLRNIYNTCLSEEGILCQGGTWKHKFLLNLLTLFAYKNIHLSNRTFHTSSKTIRGKLTAYLNYMALKKGVKDFKIPFNRQQLADYLNVDRTSLSKEITKMKNDGLIECTKNHFKIIYKIIEE